MCAENVKMLTENGSKVFPRRNNVLFKRILASAFRERLIRLRKEFANHRKITIQCREINSWIFKFVFMIVCLNLSFKQSERIVFTIFSISGLNINRICVIGKDPLAENHFTDSKNIYIKLVGNLCVSSVTHISIIMTTDELWYIKTKECPCDKKKMQSFL